MSRFGDGLAIAAAFVWLGMVLGISFLEAPIKFRAPGVTLPLGLGIGRLVFRGLNGCEAVFAVVVLIGSALGPDRPVALALGGALAAILLVQVTAVRPGLDRRAEVIIAGGERTPSRGHLVYIGLELGKVALLLALGIALVSDGLR